MINGTNLLGKHNPRWPNGNATETARLLAVTQLSLTAPRRSNGLGFPKLTLPTWLSRLTHQAGARLFAPNDAEAGWRDWQITELCGGLARTYRDPRFDALRALHDVAEQLSARGCVACPKDQDGPRQ